MDMSARPTGKVALAVALGVLDDHQQRFITMLSGLRNRVVHDVKNVSFSFLTHVRSFDKNQRKAFVDAVVFSIRTRSKDQLKSQWAQSVLDTPKQSIWLAGLFLLSNIRINIDTLHYQRDLREHPVPDFIREMTRLIADIRNVLG
jgi:hypothetical protein